MADDFADLFIRFAAAIERIARAEKSPDSAAFATIGNTFGKMTAGCWRARSTNCGHVQWKVRQISSVSRNVSLLRNFWKHRATAVRPMSLALPEVPQQRNVSAEELLEVPTTGPNPPARATLSGDVRP